MPPTPTHPPRVRVFLCAPQQGPSGAGKSTLLDLLASRKGHGLLHGDITLNGHELPTERRALEALRRNIACVPRRAEQHQFVPPCLDA